MTEEKTWANISRFQTYLFNSGDNFKSYEMLGSHKVKIDGVDGWRFAVWAPKAVSVRVVGDFNDWNGYDKMLERIETSGVWYGFFTDIEEGMLYKYAIEAEDGETYYKADPYAVKSELRPGTASVTKDISNARRKTAFSSVRRAGCAPFTTPIFAPLTRPADGNGSSGAKNPGRICVMFAFWMKRPERHTGSGTVWFCRLIIPFGRHIIRRTAGIAAAACSS